MIRPIEAVAREGFRLWLRYDDGASGEVDLSHLAERGVFAAWSDRAFFERAHITPHRSIAWSDEIELCPDALYLRLTGKTVEELMPAARGLPANA